MPDTTDRQMTVSNGEGYLFRAIDFGIEGLKVELYDPRDLDQLDRDRLHAVILKPKDVRNLLLLLLNKSTKIRVRDGRSRNY